MIHFGILLQCYEIYSILFVLHLILCNKTRLIFIMFYIVLLLFFIPYTSLIILINPYYILIIHIWAHCYHIILKHGLILNQISYYLNSNYIGNKSILLLKKRLNNLMVILFCGGHTVLV